MWKFVTLCPVLTIALALTCLGHPGDEHHLTRMYWFNSNLNYLICNLFSLISFLFKTKMSLPDDV